MSSTLYYSTLSRIIYPPFRKKVTTIDGLDNFPARGGCIIAANHVDWLDGFYIAATVDHHFHRPVHFLTKSGNYWWTTLAVQIPPDRGAIVDTAVQKLQAGQVICNFPEGERSPDGKLQPGKTGTVRMAAAASVPVVPLGITCDAGRNMGQSLQFLLSRAHPVDLRFGPPLSFTVPPTGVTAEWLTSETERLMNVIAPLCGKK